MISDVLYIILYRIVGYRKKIVTQNISLVFPNKSSSEKKEIIRSFYLHFCDLIVEGIKAFNMSDASILKRYPITGYESTFDHFEEGRDIIVSCAHQGNWEWASLACPLFFRHKCAVIVTPLTDPYLNRKINNSRSRNGYDLVPKDMFRQYTEEKGGVPKAIFFLSDQSPSNPKNAYWTPFVGVDSPVQYGVEKYAKQLKAPVYYIEIKKVKRGYYQGHVSLLIEDPTTKDYGEIVEKVTETISQSIYDRPSDWLWSHRRWKHKKNGIKN